MAVQLNHSDLKLPGASFTLARCRVPSCFLMRAQEIAAPDDEGSVLLDIVVERGRITSLRSSGLGNADTPPAVDAGGRQVWAALIDMHAHLDQAQVIPRVRPDGTLEGGLRLTAADRKHWSAEDLRVRMNFGLRCAYVHGVAAIRTHLDSHEGLAEGTWSVFRELQTAWRDRVTLQPVGMV